MSNKSYHSGDLTLERRTKKGAFKRAGDDPLPPSICRLAAKKHRERAEKAETDHLRRAHIELAAEYDARAEKQEKAPPLVPLSGVYRFDPETGKFVLRDGFNERFPLNPADIQRKMAETLKKALDQSCRDADLDPEDPDIVSKAQKELERIEAESDKQDRTRLETALARLTRAPAAAVKRIRDLFTAQQRAAQKEKQ